MEYILTAGVVAAAGYDLAQRRIPNWINLSLLAAGLGWGLATGGTGGLGRSILGLLLGLALFLPPYLGGGLGAGDVKLMAAVGACLGPEMTFQAALAGALAGGVMALAALVFSRRLAGVGTNFLLAWQQVRAGDWQTGKNLAGASGVKLPYGVALALGTLWTLFSGVRF